MSPRNAFVDQTCLITGASEGIGRATALEFARQGAHLILVARNQERLESLKGELKNHGVRVDVFAVDLSKEQEGEAFFRTAPAYDMAVNNAGTEGVMDEVQNLTLSDYHQVFDLNVRAVFQCLKHQVAHFRTHKKKGAIVNISSILGTHGIGGSSLYTASKHAVIGFTKAVAVEQRNHGIRVNCVSPGTTDTAMIHRILGTTEVQSSHPTRLGSRWATPSEVAQAILWLCSDASSYVVGHNLVVDAGRTVNLGN